MGVIHNPLAVESDLLATPSRGLSSSQPQRRGWLPAAPTTGEQNWPEEAGTHVHTHTVRPPQPSAVALILGEKQDKLNEIFY